MTAEAIAVATTDSRHARSASGAALDIFRVRQYFNVVVGARDMARAIRADARFLDAVRRGLLPLPSDRQAQPPVSTWPGCAVKPAPSWSSRCPTGRSPGPASTSSSSTIASGRSSCALDARRRSPPCASTPSHQRPSRERALLYSERTSVTVTRAGLKFTPGDAIGGPRSPANGLALLP